MAIGELPNCMSIRKSFCIDRSKVEFGRIFLLHRGGDRATILDVEGSENVLNVPG